VNGWALVAAVALLAMNGFFVAVEFSAVASRQSRLEEVAATGGRRARTALASTKDLTLLLAGAQLGVAIASLVLGSVAEPAAVQGIESLVGPLHLPDAATDAIGLVIGLGLVIVAHLVLGEMVPRWVSLADPERMLVRLAVPNRWWLRIFGPVIRVIQGMSNLIVRAFGVEPRDELSMAKTADELAELVAESHEEGVIKDFAHDLLSGALDFGGRAATDVMVRRDEVVSVPRTATVREIEEVVVDQGVSRLPVTGRDLDDVVGFVHSKDLLAVTGDGRDRAVPVWMIRRVLVVAPDRTLENVLASMRRSRVHLAVVRDAEGRTVGLLTLEDLLEELVGDIVDETDVRPNVPE
jgi:CBS domain containing-hemolysin-like protein